MLKNRIKEGDIFVPLIRSDNAIFWKSSSYIIVQHINPFVGNASKSLPDMIKVKNELGESQDCNAEFFNILIKDGRIKKLTDKVEIAKALLCCGLQKVYIAV